MDARRETALNWARNWELDHLETLHKLETAITLGHLEVATRYCSQIRALHEKGLSALPRVIEALSDEDIA